ncbi:unnamed protein product [Timema podura]|uniref:Uncharacterized protein n=1 Tax=Timema podura TaxID=61482 RepID=A0ABN7NG90_TIMPD|nr:unnamed protein product [Timema podura]
MVRRGEELEESRVVTLKDVGAFEGPSVVVGMVKNGPAGGVLFGRRCPLQSLLSVGLAGAAGVNHPVWSQVRRTTSVKPFLVDRALRLFGVLFGAEYRGKLVTDGLENMDCGAVQAVERVGGAACESAEERDKGRLNSEAQHTLDLALTSLCYGQVYHFLPQVRLPEYLRHSFKVWNDYLIRQAVCHTLAIIEILPNVGEYLVRSKPNCRQNFSLQKLNWYVV